MLTKVKGYLIDDSAVGGGLTKSNNAVVIDVDSSVDFSSGSAVWTFSPDQLQISGTPNSSGDIASKEYVDSVASGLTIKSPVRALAVDNITLSGEQTIDGVSLTTGDRVALTGQSTASQNGIYIVDSGAWSRSTDFDSDVEVVAGAFFFVTEGTSYADTRWVLTTDDPIVVDSTNLTITQFGGATEITAGDGIEKTGNILSLDLATGGGLKFATGELTIEPNDFAGTGLEDDGSDNLRLATQGNGIAGGNGTVLSVLADTTGGANLATVVNVSANGVAVSIDDSTIIENGSNQLEVDVTNFINTSAGLDETTNVIEVKLEADGGLQFDGVNGGIEILLEDSSLTVGASGLKVNANSIDENHLTTSVAGNGLTGGNGTALAVEADATADNIEVVAGGVKQKALTAGNVYISNGTNMVEAQFVVFKTNADSTDVSNGYVDVTTAFTTGFTTNAQIFIDGILMEEGVGNDYTIGLDDSSALKRITFESGVIVDGSKIRVDYATLI